MKKAVVPAAAVLLMGLGAAKTIQPTPAPAPVFRHSSKEEHDLPPGWEDEAEMMSPITARKALLDESPTSPPKDNDCWCFDCHIIVPGTAMVNAVDATTHHHKK